MTRTAHRRRIRALVAGVALAATALSGCASTATPSASASSGAASGPGAATAPTVRGYAFPPGMLDVNGVDVFTPTDGVLALPASPGPHPLALIVHGSYPNCIDAAHDKLLPAVATVKWVEGCTATPDEYTEGLTAGPDYVRATASFAYLAEQLAAQGIAAAVVDVSSKERLGWTFDANPFDLQTAIVKAHLALLGKLNGGESMGLPWGADVKGKLDLGNLLVVGHSTGGGYAAATAYRQPFPGIRAVVALQPSHDPFDTERAMKTLAPTLVVVGECDEQVGKDGLELASELATHYPTGTVLTATMSGTTHIGLLAGGGSHRVGLVTPVNTPGCLDKALQPKQAQQGTVAQLAVDFLAATLAGRTSYELGHIAGLPTTAASLTKAASVTLRESAQPPIADPKAVAFADSSTTVLKAKPADLKIGSEQEDFETVGSESGYGG